MEHEFPDLRIRWSPSAACWQVEQRVGRAAFDPVPLRDTPEDDRWIRAKDGYALVMEITPRPEFKCYDCGFWLTAPHCQTKEVRCDYCLNHRRLDGRHWAGWWPFTEALLTHLRKTDPRRTDYVELSHRHDEANRRLLEARRRKADADSEALWLDNYNQITETEQVGYTRRVFGETN